MTMTEQTRQLGRTLCLAPPRTIDTPVDPAPQRFGLLNMAITNRAGDADGAAEPNEQFGGPFPIQFLPWGYGNVTSFEAWDDTITKDFSRTAWPQPDIPKFYGIGILAADTCSTFEVRDMVGRAKLRLERSLSQNIASELWNGAVSIASTSDPNPYLADGNALDVGLAATGVFDADKAVLGIAEAIGALEAAADKIFGSRIMLHMNPVIGSALAANHMTYRQGSFLLTETRDSVIVLDSGYPLTGDWTGSAYASRGTAKQGWIYATSYVHIDVAAVRTYGANRGDPRFYELFTRSKNDAVAVAETAARYYFDPSVQLKAHVDYSQPFAV